MSELRVGDTVHFNRDNPTKLKCPFFVVERFSNLVPDWGRRFRRGSGAVIAPCNSRTLTRVPGRKTQIVDLREIRQLNVLEALARVS